MRMSLFLEWEMQEIILVMGFDSENFVEESCLGVFICDLELLHSSQSEASVHASGAA
jgi:hypothetical protein